MGQIHGPVENGDAHPRVTEGVGLQRGNAAYRPDVHSATLIIFRPHGVTDSAVVGRESGPPPITRASERQERYTAALQAAFVAIAVEPTRETAHRLAIQVHLAEGNTATAVKHYQRYRALLSRELGVAPTERLNHLVLPLLSS